jgi:hypothetical protein
MMRPEDRAREMLAESGIPETGSTMLMDSLTALGRSLEEVEPQPGPVLTSLMADAARTPRRRRARMVVASAVALGTLGAGGVAAAANELPDGAQDLVAKFSERYLPFDLPRAETPGVDPDTWSVPSLPAPPSSQSGQADGPALSPAGEAPDEEHADARARDQVASSTTSKNSSRSPSLTGPAKTRPTPAAAPAEAPVPGQVGEPGGAAAPGGGEAPTIEPPTGDGVVGEVSPPEASAGAEDGAEASPAADAGVVPDTGTGQQAEKSQGGLRRGSGGGETPSTAPADVSSR